jgi:hypothetical protein
MNPIRKWKRVMAVGCTHGDLGNKDIQKQVLKFKDDFKPHVRFDLGDIVDTAAFRTGAVGTPDETHDVENDYLHAIQWLKKYQPTHISWGNHDDRLPHLMSHPNALISYAAGQVWHHLQDTTKELKALTVPYDYEHGWFEMGGHYWGHGYWYNMQAVRDTAEYLGGPVVMAHLHHPEQTPGRTRKGSTSYCVGTLADIDSMKYARRRRATSRWGHGVVFGEICDTEAQLWLASCPKGGSLRFPMK